MANVDEQVRTLGESLRRDERHADRKGSVRRAAYKRILDLAHSPDAPYKKLATERIQDFFADFPDLQDQAINAIYDLCEDQDPQIRIAGYEAITSVSKADKNWLVRNADVLVQLLQSDDQDEVTVVKRAILDHIEMDPDRTLQVLCDQCVFELDGLDNEEKALRNRLRTLVISFLARDAKATIEHVVKMKELNADEILFRGLLNAIPKATYEENQLIVSNILLSVSPSLKTRGPWGKELLEKIIVLVNTSLRDELRTASPNEHTSLSNTQLIFRLAKEIALRSGAADPLILLTFLLSSGLVSKMTLQKLTEGAQISMIAELAEAWNACDELAKRDKAYERDVPTLLSVRNQVVQACPILFEPLIKSRLMDGTSSTACLQLLHACQSRKNDSTWAMPTNLFAFLEEIQSTATDAQKQVTGQKGAAESHRDVLQSIQNLCRSLLDSKRKISETTTTGAPAVSGPPPPEGINKRANRLEIRRPQPMAKGSAVQETSSIGGPAPVSKRFAAVNTNGEGSSQSIQGGIAGQSAGEPSNMMVDVNNQPSKRKLDDAAGDTGTPTGPTNGVQRRFGKRPAQGGTSSPVDDGTPRQPKRPKQRGMSREDVNMGGGGTPSLLSRMQEPQKGASNVSSPRQSNQNQRMNNNPQRSARLSDIGNNGLYSSSSDVSFGRVMNDVADGGFRIKGAATQPNISISSSLLDRIGGGDESPAGSLGGGGRNNGAQGGEGNGARQRRKYKR